MTSAAKATGVRPRPRFLRRASAATVTERLGDAT